MPWRRKALRGKSHNVQWPPMKKLLLLAVLLTGCTPGAVSLDKLLKNPLYAEYYYSDLADRLATIEINREVTQNKPITDNAELMRILTETKDRATANAAAAQKARDRAGVGGLVPVLEDVRGQVMLIDGTLFTGPTFDTPPGVDLQLYLSPSIDPRDVVFPDDGSVAIGPVTHHYGAAAYDAPHGHQWRTAVLYDLALHRIYGFAQLTYGPDAE